MVPKSKNKLIFISLIFSIAFIVLVIIYVINHKENLTQKFLWKFNTETIIMFGDSHTANCSWNNILGRCDVLKIAYGGFTTDQLKIIMEQQIVDRNASYCFIQCGGNDINQKEFDPNQMKDNFKFMINYLKENEITPVLQFLFHRPNLQYNLRIDRINAGLRKLALDSNIDYLDVNIYLDENNNIGEHVLSDNIHLNQKGYEIWGNVVRDYLEEKGIN